MLFSLFYAITYLKIEKRILLTHRETDLIYMDKLKICGL
jgi:hypothetical protein